MSSSAFDRGDFNDDFGFHCGKRFCRSLNEPLDLITDTQEIVNQAVLTTPWGTAAKFIPGFIRGYESEFLARMGESAGLAVPMDRPLALLTVEKAGVSLEDVADMTVDQIINMVSSIRWNRHTETLTLASQEEALVRLAVRLLQTY